ncbi:MAG TPA: 23S rRNA (adenine(2503)-C(2))-methyltransferase RlmN [Phycisphaerales bacterium]|nr:23S rRNA (adenine(2503)-C(2))-methyltransferase RlmN [Phycisphaerales bacterium]
MPAHFFDFTSDTLAQWCAERDLPNFAARQIMEWIYQKKVVEPERMTNLAKRARELLAEHLMFDAGALVRHQSATDGTQKLLLDWSGAVLTSKVQDSNSLPIIGEPSGGDSNRQTECVMIPVDDDEHSRRTACISSQIGCPVGCRFCASGLGGLDGNLTIGQIVEQAHRLSRLEGVDRISNVVFMGMGEPLANFANVTGAIRTLNAPWGMGIGARKITISTVGLPAAIRKLVIFEIPVTLALSLHAPNDELRRQLIPWAEYATIDEILDACDEWFAKTGREITLEYLLLRNVNDRPEHADELGRVAKSLRANVNLIRYNEVKGLPYDRPTTEDVLTFQKVLREAGVNTHIRASRGRDIAAACGQLRHEHRDPQRA